MVVGSHTGLLSFLVLDIYMLYMGSDPYSGLALALSYIGGGASLFSCASFAPSHSLLHFPLYLQADSSEFCLTIYLV